MGEAQICLPFAAVDEARWKVQSQQTCQLERGEEAEGQILFLEESIFDVLVL